MDVNSSWHDCKITSYQVQIVPEQIAHEIMMSGVLACMYVYLCACL